MYVIGLDLNLDLGLKVLVLTIMFCFFVDIINSIAQILVKYNRK